MFFVIFPGICTCFDAMRFLIFLVVCAKGFTVGFTIFLIIAEMSLALAFLIFPTGSTNGFAMCVPIFLPVYEPSFVMLRIISVLFMLSIVFTGILEEAILALSSVEIEISEG